jgi:hypothetical protein
VGAGHALQHRLLPAVRTEAQRERRVRAAKDGMHEVQIAVQAPRWIEAGESLWPATLSVPVYQQELTNQTLTDRPQVFALRCYRGRISMSEFTIEDRLTRIEDALRSLLQQRVQQAFYSTSDVAKMLGKAEFTVREWCRLRRIQAEKRPCGRGNSKEWMISHDEFERIRAEGLLRPQF